MRKPLSCVLLFAVLLAGCAAGGEPVSLPEQSSPVPEPAAVSQPAVPAEPVLVDEPGSPYPMVAERWSTDMDGDGIEELVELWAEKAYTSDGFETTQHNMHPYTIVVTKGACVWERPLGQDDNLDMRRWYFYGDSGYTDTFWTVDRSGRPVLAMYFDNMSQGGAGGIDVYALAFQDGEPVFLPVPFYSIRSTLDREAMTSRVTIPETGYTEALDLMEYLERGKTRNPDDSWWEPEYDENGLLTWPAAPKGIDGFYAAERAERGITLRQYVFGTHHADGMGALVTTLSWENGEAVVLDQYFDWD